MTPSDVSSTLAEGARRADERLETAGIIPAPAREHLARIGTSLSRLIEEEPAVAILGAVLGGFVLGGGLRVLFRSRVLAALALGAARNVGTMVALDVVRRRIGGSDRPDSRPATA